MAVPAQAEGTKQDGVAWWRRGLVVLAALAAAAAAAWFTAEQGPQLWFLYWPWVGVALAPVLARDPRAFRRWCLGACLPTLLVGVVFLATLPAGVTFLLFGVQAFAPTGVVLLCAALAGRRPLAWPLVVAGLLVGVVVLVFWAQALAYLLGGTPNALVVEFDPQGYREAYGVLHPLAFSPPPFGRGATGVSAGHAEWTVFFREDLSPQERGSLEAYLRGLPAVTSVRPCDTRRRRPEGCRFGAYK